MPISRKTYRPQSFPPDTTMQRRLVPFILAALHVMAASAAASTEELPSPAAIKELTQRVADWQIDTFEDHVKYRALSAARLQSPDYVAKPYHDLRWHMAALYAGMDQWRRIADDPQKHTAWLVDIGKRHQWRLYDRPYHADDHAVGQFYLSLYSELKDPDMLRPTQEQFDFILANPRSGSLDWDAEPSDAHHRWGWCDALFMAPPVWARLAKVTGESKYLHFMDQEYHVTYDLLWDKEEQLFWRDSSFFERRERNGEKLFWARGNGWVIGGLALMIPDLPADWEGRAFYVDLFKRMAERLKACQRPDGTWSMGLLGSLEDYPVKETSGTAFFTFAFAWGINNGLLDKSAFLPVVQKSWNALAASVTPEGLLGHVQPVGAAPGDSYPDKTEVYGVGAFLAAGAEVYKLAQSTAAE